jgi:hypothetical protein
MPTPRPRPRYRCRICGVVFSACPGLKLSGAGEPDGALLSPRQNMALLPKAFERSLGPLQG